MPSGWEQGGGGVKSASGTLLSKEDIGVGKGGSSVLLGLLMSPSPTSVRSAGVSSTVRRLERGSGGRGMGERWVPNVGWRGGGSRQRLAVECPLALELREESRLSERMPEVRDPRGGGPFSRPCLSEEGVELARSEEAEQEEVGGVTRRKSGSTRSSLLRSPRWSFARLLWARLSSSKNSGKTGNKSRTLLQSNEAERPTCSLPPLRSTPDKVSPHAKQAETSDTGEQTEEEEGLPSASSILIFLFFPGSAESGPLALRAKSFGVDLSSPCRCNNNNGLC